MYQGLKLMGPDEIFLKRLKGIDTETG